MSGSKKKVSLARAALIACRRAKNRMLVCEPKGRMSSHRQPGLLCQYSSPVYVEDGTLGRVASSLPGTVSSVLNSGRDYFRRLSNLKAAFELGIAKYALAETFAKLGSDAKLLIESIWPSFVQVLEIYAVSIGAGAVVGGLVGGLLGEGIGAVPGVAIGAELGIEVATALLYFLGIKFLAEYVLAHLGEAEKHFRKGCTLAWEARGDSPPLDEPAREFGRAFASLFSLIVEAAGVFVVAKGLKTGLSKLQESEAGRALAPYVRVQYWREKLGLTDAPIPRRGLATTLEFFEMQIRKGKLKALTEEEQLSYMKAMDFSKDVEVEMLKLGDELVGYRDPRPGKEFGYFYTKPGTFLDRVGVDYVTGSPPLPREFMRYRVLKEVEVLKSISSGVKAWDTRKPVAGGGTQYFIPDSWNVLQIIKPKP